MKKTKTAHSIRIKALSGIILLGLSAAPAPAPAHEGVDHSKGGARGEAHDEDHDKDRVAKPAKAAAPAPDRPAMGSHDGMTALYARLHEIETRLAANQLDHFHEAMEGIATATRDLDRDTTLDAARKKRVQGYVKNVAKLMDKLHAAVDGKKPEEAKKALAQLKAQVDLLDKQFAHSHKPAHATKPPAAAPASKSGRDSSHSSKPLKQETP